MFRTPTQKRKNFIEEMLANGEFDNQPIINNAPPQLIGGAGVYSPPIYQRDPYEEEVLPEKIDPNIKPVQNYPTKPAFRPERKPVYQGRPNPRQMLNRRNPFFNAFQNMMF